jgi:aspartyl-tRNA(Asn)/glutamyl-tRNA(Gln) amidotransferase subunit A
MGRARRGKVFSIIELPPGGDPQMPNHRPPAGEDLAFEPATRLARLMRERRITAESVVAGYLDRIGRYDEKLSAFIAVYADDALRAARAADQARAAGHAVGPLHGLPVAVKDIVDIEGRVTTGGSAVWRERVSPATAELVSHLLAAGLVILGKTHTVEFAMGSFGTNRHMGTPWNPWDQEVHRAPGGSSSGTAVAVAAGLAPWGIGTDTGGSVRLPSAWCGLVGLKTTVGRVSTDGVLPLSTTLDTPGPLCRTVADAALLYDVLRGAGTTVRRRLGAGVAGLRLARLPNAELEAASPGVRAAYEASLECFAGLGARIVEAALPLDFAAMGAMTGRIIGAEGYSFVGDLVDDPALPVDDDVRPRIQLGKGMSAREYLETLRERKAVKAAFESALADADALLTPTIAEVAPPVDAIDQSSTAATFTRPFNLVDWCALALPNGRCEGLPSSLQIACPGNAEELALRIGFAYEQAAGHAGRRPPWFA